MFCYIKTNYFCLILIVLSILQTNAQKQEHSEGNGDIYLVNITKIAEDVTPMELDTDMVNSDALLSLCNASFSIPMDYYVEFNTTGDLPTVVDKTGMCFLRCYYEKAGYIENWQLNVERIRKNIWPATGDSIEYCQQQGKTETNACVRTYAIAKCLMIRAIVDARNTPLRR